MNTIIVTGEGTENQTICIKNSSNELEICSKDIDDDVTIEFYNSQYGTSSFYVNQTQLKAIIKHLEAQVVPGK